MIVRIATEDQYEMSKDHYEQVNDLDNAVVEAVEADDAERYAKAFAQLIDFIRTNGTPVDDDALVESDVIIPPSDTDLAEAKRDFTGEGVIPESMLPGTS